MIYNNYSKATNIAHDWIRWPCLRVSSAEIPSYLDGAPFGVWYETWIFSDCLFIRTNQAIFDTKIKCLKAHEHIVKNVCKKLNEHNLTLRASRNSE